MKRGLWDQGGEAYGDRERRELWGYGGYRTRYEEEVAVRAVGRRGLWR